MSASRPTIPPADPTEGPRTAEEVVVGKDVWKVYGQGATEVTALRGIDLAIRRGEMLAVVGPSGCGKTTFLNCFSGLDDISRGTVMVEGTNIHTLPDAKKSEYRARRTGFVFQSYNLLPILTAEENVEMPLLIAGRPAKESRAEARAILGQMGLGDRLTHRPSELSGGEQQRVSLARALVAHPAIVWADEPTGNLDAEGSREVTDLLRQLNRQFHQTMVVVTHDTDVAKACDRTLHMRDGQFVG
jgi:putative ABC transport system ATP-binding protein